MTTETPLNLAELKAENRQLRRALEAMLEETESSGPVDTTRVRKQMSASEAEKNPIEPPWEREGYDSKEAWLADRNA